MINAIFCELLKLWQWLGETINQLNSIELCLLILTAYYHDQGMVMNEEEYASLSSDPKFQLFREN
jgi:hypothetical protein